MFICLELGNELDKKNDNHIKRSFEEGTIQKKSQRGIEIRLKSMASQTSCLFKRNDSDVAPFPNNASPTLLLSQ